MKKKVKKESGQARIPECLKKAYAFTYALHEIADSGGLELLGDEDAFIILDEVVVQLQELMKIFEDEKKAA